MPRLPALPMACRAVRRNSTAVCRTSSRPAGRADRQREQGNGGMAARQPPFSVSGAKLGWRSVFLEGADMELLLRGLYFAEQAALTLAHAFFGRDLKQARIQFPLLEDLRLLIPVDPGARDDLVRALEDAARV